MFKISSDILTNKYKFVKIKDIDKYDKLNNLINSTLYAKSHSNGDITLLYYDNNTNFVVRQTIYHYSEVADLLDSLAVLDNLRLDEIKEFKKEFKNKNKKSTKVFKWFNSIAILHK